MYWQKRFDRKNPNEELENIILEIRSATKILAIDEFMVNYANVECV